MINRLLNLFFPEVCNLCRKNPAGPAEEYLCTACRTSKEGIIPIQQPFCHRCGLPSEGAITTEYECSNCTEMNIAFSKARAAVELTEVMREVIVRFKYSDALWFEPLLGKLLVNAAAPELLAEKPDAIIPVPLHRARRRERGMNQAEVLSRHLSKATGIPVQGGVLLKTRQSQSQTRMDRETRIKNVRGTFELKKGANVQGWKVVLVDDVLTTGATASECARILTKSGAADVAVWTVARTIALS